MPDIDELDRIWREGLSSAAGAMPPVTDPTARVAERVRRRERARARITAIGVVAVIALMIVLAVSVELSSRRADIATPSPVARVDVEVLVGGQLQIRFPGRSVGGQPPRVELPSGLIRFDVRSAGTDRLVIDGIPEFVAVLGPTDTVTRIVRIPPGRYLMHSTIAGHAEAGEKAILVVK